MKKFYLLLGLVSCHTLTYGQQSYAANIDIPKNSTEINQTQVMFKKNGEFVKGYINNIPSIVLTDFIKRYDDPSIVSWYIDDFKITGYFSLDNGSYIITYKKNGYLLSTQRTYDSSAVDKPLKAVLANDLRKSYHVRLVTEIITEDITFYKVTLVNGDKVCVINLSRKKMENPVIADRMCYTQVTVEKI